MACLHLRTPLRSFSAFQPQLRSSSLNQHRSFSASQPKRLSAIDCIIWGPNTVLNGFHSLGLPWYAAIPISAVVIRSTVGYFFTVRPRRRRAQVRAQLTPIVAAQWKNQRMTREEMQRLRQMSGLSRSYYMFFSSTWAMIRKTREFSSRSYMLAPLANVFVLLASAQAIRMKCGGRNGLLGLLVGGVQNSAYHFDTWLHKASQSLDALALELARSAGCSELHLSRLALRAEEGARQYQERWANVESIRQNPQLGTTGNLGAASEVNTSQDPDAVATAMANTLRGPDLNSPYFDPSMQIEGFSWLQDLTIPDTTFALPVLFLGAGIVSAMFRPTAAGASTKYWFLPSTNWVKEAMMILSCVFVFVSVHFPAAILLYLIPSAITGYVQGRYMDITAPNNRPIMACKRPIRLKTRQQFDS